MKMCKDECNKEFDAGMSRGEDMSIHKYVGKGGWIGKKRCATCDTFLEYTGVVWACPTCENDKFEYCDKRFDSESAVCKCCNIAVECYEAST